MILRTVLRAGASCCFIAVLARPTDLPRHRLDVSSPGTICTARTSIGAPAAVALGAEASAAARAASGLPGSIDVLIESYASHYGVRVSLVRALIEAESAFNPRALSSKGAMGLMQLMPATAEYLGVVDAFDPSENLRGGVAYLRHLLDRYHGDERLALAAYNAGPGAVERFGRTTPPFPETREHAARTIAAETIVAATDGAEGATSP